MSSRTPLPPLSHAPRRARPRALLFVLAASLVAAACSNEDDPRALRATANAYFEAIHERDFLALAEVDASAPPVREGPMFTAWTRAVYELIEGYERSREEGRIEFDPQGYRLVRASMLGRGAFWEPLEFGEEPGARTMRIRINFGYDDISFSSLPPGTQIFLLGWPLGTVHALTLGRGGQYELELLTQADAIVRFVQPETALEGDAEWKVESVRLVEGSVEHELFGWIL